MKRKFLCFTLAVMMLLSSFMVTASGIGYVYTEKFFDETFAYSSDERAVLGDIVDTYVELENPDLIVEFTRSFIGGNRFDRYDFIFDFADDSDGYVKTSELENMGGYIAAGNKTAFKDAFDDMAGFETDLGNDMTESEMETYFMKFGVSLYFLDTAKNDGKIGGYNSVMFIEDSSGDLSIAADIFKTGGMYEDVQSIGDAVSIKFPPTDEAEDAAQDFVDKYNSSPNSDKEILFGFLAEYNLVDEYNYHAEKFITKTFAYSAAKRAVLGDIADSYDSLQNPVLITNLVQTLVGGTRYANYSFIVDFIDDSNGYIDSQYSDDIGGYIAGNQEASFRNAFDDMDGFDADLESEMTLSQMETYFSKFGVILYFLDGAKVNNTIGGFDSEIFTEDENGDISIADDVFASGGMYETIQNIGDAVNINFPETATAENYAQDFVDEYNASASADKAVLRSFMDEYKLVEKYVPPVVVTYDHAEKYTTELFAYDSGQRDVMADFTKVYVLLDNADLASDLIQLLLGGIKDDIYGFMMKAADSTEGYIESQYIDNIAGYIDAGSETAFRNAFADWAGFDSYLEAEMTVAQMDTLLDDFGFGLDLLDDAESSEKISGQDSTLFIEDKDGNIELDDDVFASSGIYQRIQISGDGRYVDFPATEDAEDGAQAFVDAFNAASASDKDRMMDLMVQYNLVKEYSSGGSSGGGGGSSSGGGGGSAAVPSTGYNENGIFGSTTRYNHEAAQVKKEQINAIINNLNANNLNTLTGIGDLLEGLINKDAMSLIESILQKLSQIGTEEAKEAVNKLWMEIMYHNGWMNLYSNSDTIDVFNEENLVTSYVSSNTLQNLKDKIEALRAVFGEYCSECGFKSPNGADVLTYVYDTNENPVTLSISQDAIGRTGYTRKTAIRVIVNGVVFHFSSENLNTSKSIMLYVEKLEDGSYEFKTDNGNFMKPVLVEMPYDGSNGNAAVFRYNENSGQYKKLGGYYDMASGMMKFYTSHFSRYEIMGVDPVIFGDIDTITWGESYRDTVRNMAAKGYIKGRGNNFDPFASITRAEFAAMLVRLLDASELHNGNIFSDISSSDWYFREVSAAHRLGLVNGVSATEFDPDSNITREQMAAMAARFLKLKFYYENGQTNTTFADNAQISSWAKGSVNLMEETGIMKGRSIGGDFDPQGMTTRLEALIVMERLLAK